MQLIDSMTRSEKRHFRMYVGRNPASEDMLFMQLFDYLDKHKFYDEAELLKKLPDIKKAQLSNLKAHLFKQMLISLRLLHKNGNDDIQIREMIDYARVLYNKGLYRQSLDILDKAKSKAFETRHYTLALEVVEFEKLIEGQYITRSIADRAEQLTVQAIELNNIVAGIHAFTNLSLQLYGLYLKVGFVRNKKDYFYVKAYFQARLPKYNYDQLDFWGKVYFCQSHVWYYHMTQEFALCYRYAQKWVDLFHESPQVIRENPPLYLKGLHNLLNALFNTLYYKRFAEVLLELLDFPNHFDLAEDKNVEGLFYLYKYIHSIKKHYLEGTFSEGLLLVPELDALIKNEEYNWDNHRVMVFYYRIACLYFGSGDNSNAIHYLNLIINQKNPDYREDIQGFARILSLIAHFELGNAQLVEYQVKSVFRFLLKKEDLNEVHKAIFSFLRKIPRMRANELRTEFIRLRDKLRKLESDPYERRPFLYLDIISWLDSKIAGKGVQEIIRQKFLERQNRP